MAAKEARPALPPSATHGSIDSDKERASLQSEVPPVYEDDPEVDRRLLRKIDLRILPNLCVIGFLAGMDRNDLANARVAGLQTDLKLKNGRYQLAISIFFLGYVLFQLPGNLLVRKVTPPLQLALAMICWGTVTACMAAVHNGNSLVALRFLLGVFEAFAQAGPLYAGIWYTPRELASRAAFSFGVGGFAGSFTGLIAYGLVKDLKQHKGLAPWRYIFIIEGCMTVAYGLVAYWILVPVPEKLRWGFTEAEKRQAIIRTQKGNNRIHSEIHFPSVIKGFLSLKNLLLALSYGGGVLALAGVANFLPTILVEDLRYSTVRAQLMTAPIYAVGAVSCFLFGSISDHIPNTRSLYIMGGNIVCIVGYGLVIGSKVAHAQYAGLVLVSAGAHCSIIGCVVWAQFNNPEFTSRATQLAFQSIIAQALSFSSAYLFDTPPRFIKGNATCLAIVIWQFCLTIILRFYLAHLNRKKDEQYGQVKHEELRWGAEAMTEDHPSFRYSL